MLLTINYFVTLELFINRHHVAQNSFWKLVSSLEALLLFDEHRFETTVVKLMSRDEIGIDLEIEKGTAFWEYELELR